jgi:Family of unknown function (DUF5832)
MNSDKNSSTVVEDFLDEDVEIPGQRYVLLSFLSPEKVLEKKEHFFFERFLKAYEVDWKIKNLERFMVDIVKHINDELDDRARTLEKENQAEQAQICRKNRLNIDNVMNQYSGFVQKSREDINKTKIKEAYDDFMFANKSKLEDEFYALNEFRTSMRGLKVRGVYGNVKEAEIKAKKLQTKDKYHNILVGDVGKWLPWDPAATEVTDQEYNNDQLNSLMKKYKENEDNREKYFEERTKNAGAGAASKKQVLGLGAEGGSASEQFGSMFNGQGDLAIQRKLEKPTLTIEKVSDTSASAENSVVVPKTE